MIFLGFLLASLVAVNSQVQPLDSRGSLDWNNQGPLSHSPSAPKSNTVIENKNVNIIVNVDPKDVAKELYKLIQDRLDGRQGRRSDNSKLTISELEKIVTPVVMPTRRSIRPTAFEVAYSLDHLTRRALMSDHLTRPTIEDEIVTRDVVAKMMTKLKELSDKNSTPDKKTNRSSPAFRRMIGSKEVETEEDNSDDDKDDQYINLNIRVRKGEILKHIEIDS